MESVYYHGNWFRQLDLKMYGSDRTKKKEALNLTRTS